MSALSDDQLNELVTIRKLLILALLRSGMTQRQIGAALGVHHTTIGRMFPTGGLGEQQKGVGKAKAGEMKAEGSQ
ncbi:MAG: helix-turn-helix domain-containing protein [Sphingomicrobium sp.]